MGITTEAFFIMHVEGRISHSVNVTYTLKWSQVHTHMTDIKTSETNEKFNVKFNLKMF